MGHLYIELNIISIVLPLAPYQLLGCCVVVRAVPRTTLNGSVILTYTLKRSNLNKQKEKRLMLQ